MSAGIKRTYYHPRRIEMKKNISPVICVILLSVFTILGCTTVLGIAKPEIPMSKQCVVDFPSGVINFGDIPLSNFKDFDENGGYVIVPTGNNRVRVSRLKKTNVSVPVQSEEKDIWGVTTAYVTTTTYTPYREIWVINYDFLSGKYYSITVKEASVRYVNKELVSDDQVKITNNPVIMYNTLISGNTVEHIIGEDIEILEVSTKNLGSTYTNFVAKVQDNVHFWDYGPSYLVNGVGVVPGFKIIRGNLNMFIGGEAGGTFSLLSGNTAEGNDWAIPLGYYLGGTVEFNFRPISFGLGGGVTGGTEYINSNSYFFPYAELDLWYFSKSRLSRSMWGLFGRYNFNDSDDWYDKYSVGLKVRY
jgi:hypothetical protein